MYNSINNIYNNKKINYLRKKSKNVKLKKLYERQKIYLCLKIIKHFT